MKTDPMPVSEITARAISLLTREIGPVNTARFLNQFTVGVGNYTAERDQLIGDASVTDLVAEIKQRRDRQKKSPKSRRGGPRS